MNPHPYILEMMAKEKQIRFEQEAAKVRLRKMARASRPNVRALFWIKIADMLISGGQAIKAKYDPSTCFSCLQSSDLHGGAKGC